ncbi:serine hydrolase domain-containing protein, partial [Asticcacaulis biprosthecium]
WRKITPRIILTHSTGFANFGFLEPDGRLKIHFEPGARYAYSGDGIILLQFAIEKGLNLDVGQLTQAQFDRLGMTRTSLIWRPDFAGNLADGWGEDGQTEPHDERSKVRAAGSMDTTITDIARFTAALVRGDGLSPASRAELTKPQLHITTRSQFNSFQPELPPEQQRKDLYAGLGVVVFDGPQGPGYYKGGHNDTTGNTMVCIEQGQRCVVILANDVRAEKAFPGLVKLILGETGVPYDWEYGFTPGAE